MSKLAELRMLGLTGTARSKNQTHYVFTVRDRIIEHDSFTKAVRAIALAHERWTLAKVPGGGCAEFCVNGQSTAGASRPVRKHNEHEETRRTRRTVVWPAGQLQEA
jgi:hypothetical protein